METEKRMAGEYEILYALHIGDREIVLGENQADENGQKYMCAFCETNEMFAQYDEVLASDDYAETVQCYGERVAQQAEKTREALRKSIDESIDNTPITAKDCDPISYTDDINNKVVVIKSEVLRREYQMATRQIKLCTGGFGASGNSRGSACYCTDLHSGKSARFERADVLGTIEKSKLPDWAREGLAAVNQKIAAEKKARAREDR